MNVNNKVKYWMDIARYDLVSAKAMLDAKRFLYVGFLCHQTVEKCIKAFFRYNIQSDPPYTHNLLILSEKSGLDAILPVEYVSFLNELMPLNIQARYPEDKDLLLKSLNAKKCRTLYSKTEEFFSWTKKLLK